MAKKITLFSRFLKAFQIAKDGVVPNDAVSAVELETGRNFAWKAKKIDLTATPAPILGDVTVTPSTATVDTPYTGTVSGRTSGSTLSLSGEGSDGLTVDSESGAISGTPTSAGPVNVVETLSGATGSPKENAGVITVSA